MTAPLKNSAVWRTAAASMWAWDERTSALEGLKQQGFRAAGVGKVNPGPMPAGKVNPGPMPAGKVKPGPMPAGKVNPGPMPADCEKTQDRREDRDRDRVERQEASRHNRGMQECAGRNVQVVGVAEEGRWWVWQQVGGGGDMAFWLEIQWDPVRSNGNMGWS